MPAKSRKVVCNCYQIYGTQTKLGVPSHSARCCITMSGFSGRNGMTEANGEPGPSGVSQTLERRSEHMHGYRPTGYGL